MKDEYSVRHDITGLKGLPPGRYSATISDIVRKDKEIVVTENVNRPFPEGEWNEGTYQQWKAAAKVSADKSLARRNQPRWGSLEVEYGPAFAIAIIFAIPLTIAIILALATI